jgi:site-specific DNA-methyltransferase (adenine-specific)
LPPDFQGESCQICGIELFRGHAISLLKSLKDDSIDVAIADPPYGASGKTPTALPSAHGLKSFGVAWKAADHSWDLLDPSKQLDTVSELVSELKRVAKPEG